MNKLIKIPILLFAFLVFPALLHAAEASKLKAAADESKSESAMLPILLAIKGELFKETLVDPSQKASSLIALAGGYEGALQLVVGKYIWRALDPDKPLSECGLGWKSKVQVW